MKPTPTNVFMLTNERGQEVAIIVNAKMYRIELLDSEEMAEMFNNGDALPIVPAALAQMKV